LSALEFTFRPATNRDLPRIKQLVFSVLAEYGLTPDPDSTDRDLEDVEKHYHGRGGAFEVVEDPGGVLVGTVGLYPLSADRVELRKMYLAPSVRGRGLGKLLLERMLQEARRLRFAEVWLETNSVLKEAVGLYRKYGFVPAEADHVSARCDQVFVHKLL